MSDAQQTAAPTISTAVTSGIFGGVLVGLTTAVIGSLFIWPSLGVGFGFGGTMLLFVIGSIFGVVAGAVAGADGDDHEEEVPASTRVVSTKPSATTKPATA